MDKLINKTRTLSTDQILEGLAVIGGSSQVTTEERMVRAAMIEVIAEREGEDAADELMATLGM